MGDFGSTAQGDDGGDWTGGGTSSGGNPTTGNADGGDTGGAGDGTDGGGPAGDEGGLPPDDEEGVNNGEEQPECDDVSDVTLFLSPDDSNSMSSPVQVREAVLDSWNSVYSVAIRPWEFFNYYNFGYEAAEADTLAITPSMMETEIEGEYVMQIGIASEEVSAATRVPVNVTLVLDTSGSMAGSAMDMLKESCLAIAASLQEGDTVSMVVWDTSNAVLMGGYSVGGPNDPTLLAEINDLEAGGGTNLNGGLTAGYELAEMVFNPDKLNRIVLISDGGANAGITDIDIISEHAASNGGDGIYMVGVGVGGANSYNDDLMDQVTDAGKGASVFVPNADEAWSAFHDNFISTMAVAARDVRVRLDMPPGFEIVSTSAEEVSTDPSEVEPQHLAPNDAMVFHQRVRTCAPELIDEESAVTVTVQYYDAATFEEHEVSHRLPILEMIAEESPSLLKGAAVFAYVSALQAIQAGEEEDAATAMDDAFAALQAAEEVLPEDAELSEIREILEALAN